MITISVYAMLRAGESGSVGWLYLIGVLIAGLILVKGPPAAYVVILMGLLDAIDGRWTRSTWRQTLTVRFVTSGAAVLMLLLAIPWFVYMRGNPEHGELANDLKNSIAGGKGHGEAWWTYFPQILVAIVPWVFVWVVAAAGSLKVVMRWTRGLDEDRRGLLIAYAWGSVVLVPLLFWGNKQPHYLLPMLPALMLATGWAIDRGLGGAYEAMRVPVRAILHVMLATGMLAAIAMPVFGGWARSGVTMVDIASGASLLIFMVGLIVWAKRQRNPLAIANAGIAGVLATLLVVKGVWAPTLEPATAESIAQELRTRYPNATFVFRDEPSMSLVVALGQSVRLLNDETLIQLAHDPDMVLVCLDESPVAPTLSHYRQDLRIETGEEDLYVLLPMQ
jgi:4-amino-4-deoxy-L-arabinose transferase-like glycosyltransferase